MVATPVPLVPSEDAEVEDDAFLLVSLQDSHQITSDDQRGDTIHATGRLCDLEKSAALTFQVTFLARDVWSTGASSGTISKIGLEPDGGRLGVRVGAAQRGMKKFWVDEIILLPGAEHILHCACGQRIAPGQMYRPMCGCIWTPPYCNGLSGSGVEVAIADVYPAS